MFLLVKKKEKYNFVENYVKVQVREACSWRQVAGLQASAENSTCLEGREVQSLVASLIDKGYLE